MLKKISLLSLYKTKEYDYYEWFTEDKLNDAEELDDMLPQEVDEEVKEEKRIKKPQSIQTINQTSNIISRNKSLNSIQLN